jgi:hypothetical protein
MQKWFLLKLFHESGGRVIKGSGGRGKFKYDIVDIL